MNDESHQSHTFLRRLSMIAASLAVATFAWLLVGESEKAIADERQSVASDKVLATVAGEPITEAAVMEAASAQLMQLARQKHETITGAVDATIRQKIVELEAEKAGVTPEEFVKAGLEKNAADIPQEELDAFWQQNEGRIRGTKEQMEPQIRQYLAQSGFYEELEGKYEITRSIDPFRVDVEAVGPSVGPADAPVTIIEFSDFECPFCGRVNPAIEKVKETYGDKIRLVFRQFPLAMHPNAPKAAEAALCAHDQGKFWEMHDALFANQKALAVADLKQTAAGLEGVDADAFAACLDSGKFADQVQEDLAAGSAAGVSGTPAFFINGRFLSGAQPFESFSEIIDDELANSAS